MIDFTTFKSLLPSQARKALTEHFLDRLERSELDCYGQPSYRLSDALGDIPRETGDYVSSIIVRCFDDARVLYQERHRQG